MRHAPTTAAPPIDAVGARSLATRLAAVADPVAVALLRRLVIASGRPVADADLHDGVEASAEEIDDRISAMVRVGLILPSPGLRHRAAPDAIITLATVLGVAADTPAPRDELPPALRRTAELLTTRFASIFSEETVRRYVIESYRLLAERATVTAHLPTLAGRFATERLGALASAQGLTLATTPEVLFVCTRNAARSQIAAASLRHLGGAGVHVRTAGTTPAARIDPLIERVLTEAGIPLPAEFPKPLTDEAVRAADFVITMGCGDACPVYPGRRYLDWPVDDPAGRTIEEVRRVRDQIIGRVASLADELGIARPASATR